MSHTSTLALGIGVLLSVCLAAIAIADQVSLGWTHADVVAHYGPFGANPDPRILTITLAVNFGCAAVALMGATLAATRGWNLAALILVALVLVTGVGFALLTTFATEFEGYVFIAFWRFVPWVVPLAAMAAVPNLVTHQ